MKCCGSESRAQACETPEMAGYTRRVRDCSRVREHRRGNDHARFFLPAVVELDVAVYRALRQRVIDLEAALREERQRSDDYEAAAHRAYGCASESHPDTSTAEH